MIKENNFCVLSTSSDNRPNSSLMQYVSSETGAEIYMLTMKGSTKYGNILNNPHVSLLVDTRVEAAGENRDIKALTAYGRAGIVTDKYEEKMLKERLVKLNPGLSVISESPESCVVRVEVESFLLLEGVNESIYGTI
jgi:nitroimidazol reductase NimA-like FMN-containing flavoprotein (pyridoxamine 5'-phosphate oxidase superfamily)